MKIIQFQIVNDMFYFLTESGKSYVKYSATSEIHELLTEKDIEILEEYEAKKLIEENIKKDSTL